MKKIFSVFICLVLCVFSLASCAEKEAAKPLNEIYSSLLNVSNMPEMSVMPDSLIETLFGFDTSIFEEYVFAEAASPDVNADAIILVKIGDNADLNSITQTLDGYLSSVKDYTQSYSPVNYQKTSNSAVTVNGSYVWLVITAEYFEAQQVINKGLGA